MRTIKVSSKVEAAAWRELQAAARESHRSISGLLTEAVQEWLRRRRVRPDVLVHLERSMDRNEELGRLLAR